jgi:adenylate cyclase
MPELQITFQDGKKFIYPITPDKDVITIGRTATNAITLNDHKVSRKHAEVQRTRDGYVLEDLHSQNGTLLNNKKITRQALKHYDVITIGACTLTFLNEAEDAPTMPAPANEFVLATLHAPRLSEHSMLVKKSGNTLAPLKGELFDLEKNNKILYVLFQISNRLNQTADLHDLLQTIMDAIFEVIEADYGFIALLDQARDTLLPQVIKHRGAQAASADEFRVSRTIMQQVIGAKISVLTTNAMHDARLSGAASIQQQNLQSVISVPLWRKDEVIGMIQIDSCRADHQFQPSDLELVSAISRQIAMILDQAYLAELQRKHQFVRETFGRYLSNEIVAAILESPTGLNLGGEKREVTILMSDLRGFTAISERLPAVDVVEIINIYLETMTEIILKYQGTIDEFIGDAILVIFGAPLKHADDAQRAVACALDMQLAMAGINAILTQKGYPEIAMGIGINTGAVAVGNVGSKKRTKYGVVGRNVNLTSRIESYTIGGQVLIADATRRACGPILRLDDELEVMPKGVQKPITIYDVGGIAGTWNVTLPVKTDLHFTELPHPLPVKIYALKDKDTGAEEVTGVILRLSAQWAEIEAQTGYPPLMNLKLTLLDQHDVKITDELYAKVIKPIAKQPAVFRVNFTAIPPEAQATFKQALGNQEEAPIPQN